MFGGLDDISLHFCYDWIIGFNDGKISGNHVLNARILEAFSHTFSVLRFCDPSKGVAQVVLAPGILDMGIKLSPFLIRWLRLLRRSLAALILAA